MCGIAGLFDYQQRRVPDRDLLGRMTRRVAHRGPDGEGLHVEPGTGLGHRRLSIIDLAGGAQPMWNGREDIAVTYNGEIYNFAALREELTARGHVFRTRSDTEVILHAWAEWGEACVEHFNGMFAFAVYDRGRQCLFLARDRLGIKPLYYTFLDDGWLAFASELKSLYAHPALDRRLCPEAVEEYFAFGYVPDPRTILKSTFKLAPGHTLLVSRGERLREPRCYWDISFDVQPGLAGHAGEAAMQARLEHELVSRLGESVQRRLVAEVPLGAFLSGGVDSSAIVALMSGLCDAPVNTCSIAFGEKDFDESRYARMVADRYRTNHHVEQVDPEDFALVDRLAEVYDEPYADSSSIPTYRVCEVARRHVTVALSGDGGDENFVGYRRYRWHAFEEQFRSRIPGAARRVLFGTAGAIYPKMDWAPRFLRAKSTLQAVGRDSLAGYLHSVSILPDDTRRRLFSHDLRTALDGYQALEVFAHHAARARVEDGISLVQYLDFKTYLPGDILTKVDRASMAHGLEVRVPMLDHEFAGWAASLPSELKLRGRDGKFLLKKSLESLLPADVLYRPKMGFGVPLARWFRGPLRERVREAVTGPELRECGLFDPATLVRLVDEHQTGQRDHTAVLWALLMFRGAQQLATGAGAREPA